MNHAADRPTARGTASSAPDQELNRRWAAHAARVQQYLSLDAEYAAIHGGSPDRSSGSRVCETREELEQETTKLRDRWCDLVTRWHALAYTTGSQTALCLSGGGIRSATFCLGVLQWLAHSGRLQQFHYLSTVSGGGYVGSWLTAWIRRQGFDKSLQALAASAGEGRTVVQAPGHAADEQEEDWGLGREPEPVRRLRAYSNYLSPALGLSGDMLALLGTFVRNLALHWLAIVPLLFAFLMLPRAYVAAMQVAAGPASVTLLTGLAAVAVVVALAFVAADLPGIQPPDSPRNDRFKQYCLLPLALAALLLAWVGYWVPSPVHVHWLGHWFGIQASSAQNTVFGWPAGLLSQILGSLPREGWLLGGLSGIVLQFLGAAVGYGWRWIRQPGTTQVAGVVIYVAAALASGFAGGALIGWGLEKLLHVNFNDWPYASMTYEWTGGHTTFGDVDAELWPPRAVATEWLGWYVTLAPPAVFAVLWIGVTLYVGLISRIRNDEHREWWARAGGYWLLAALAWILLCILVIHAPRWVLSIPAFQQAPGSAAFGAAALLGVVSSVWGYWGKHGAAVKSQVKGLADRLGTRVLDLLSLAFIVALCIAISIATSMVLERFGSQALGSEIERTVEKQASRYRDEMRCASSDAPAARPACVKKEVELPSASKMVIAQDAVLRGSHPGGLLAVLAALLLIGGLFWWSINPNRFSLHGMYRNRLTRAYLGASADQGLDASGAKRRRRAHWFTGFDPKDDISLFNELEGAKFPSGKWRLFPVLNATLNLVKPAGDRLEWQQRKAASFTFTPLRCGSPRLGYTEARNMGYGLMGAGASQEGTLVGATLGHAMAVSGAAASPNMGYHSSALVAFVMFLFNVRLGCWDRNPRASQSKNFRLPYLWLLVDEMLGRTTDTRDLVYLSDGGHFENLGLYEMVQRRCHHIVVVDAAHDPLYEYEDLENCIRKVRVDFGISIHFDRGLPTPESCRQNKLPFALGRVCYSDVDGPKARDGLIVYLKPVLCGDEPLDVRRYAASSRKGSVSFPQQPTSDQFFDEAQFESYRMLGLEVTRKAFGIERGWPTNAPDHAAPAGGPSGAAPATAVSPASAGAAEAANSVAKLAADGSGAFKSLSDAGKMALVAAGTAAIAVTGTVSLRNTELSLSQESIRALTQIQGGQDREQVLGLIRGLGEAIDGLRTKIDPSTKAAEPGGLSQTISSLSVAIGAAASAASGASGEQLTLQRQVSELVKKVDRLEEDLVRAGVTKSLVADLKSASAQLASAAGVLSKAIEKLPPPPAQPASVAVHVTHAADNELRDALLGIASTLRRIETEITSVPPRRNIRSTTEGGRQ